MSALVDLDIYGYTVLTGVLSVGQVDALRGAVHAAWRAAGPEGAFIRASDGSSHGQGQAELRNLPTRDRRYHALIDQADVLRVVEGSLGPDLLLAGMHARVVAPGAAAQPLHPDVPEALHRPGTPFALGVLWVLDDFREENGATRFVPGSHHSRWPGPPTERLPIVLPAVAPAGSALVFDVRCWHGAGANQTQGCRAAIYAQYRVGPWCRFQWDPRVGFDPAWWPALTDRQRQLLRMEHGPEPRLEADAVGG